jgi:hypothetical protein
LILPASSSPAVVSGGSTATWFHNLIRKYALELEIARKAIFQFGNSISIALTKNPIQEWEADAWARGLKIGLIRLEGYFFRVGSGKRSPLSFFVRNDRDIYVGLRRESVTQAATYVQLITDYGYPRARVRFESQWMDVAVYGEDGRASIYAENKARQKTLEKLCHRLADEFRTDIPPVNPDAPGIDDALMKAHHIWRHRPQYFWGVCPTHRLAYRTAFGLSGFRLDPVDAILPCEGLPV